jgi:hypothetical protein
VHTHDEQFAQWKPLVESLVRAQQQLCNRFLADAETLMKKLRPTDGSNVQDADALEREIGMLLFRVKTGQPKSEALMKVLENPENAGLMNRAELELHKDQKKVDLYREKEELLFAIDEKSQEADLTEKGRTFVSPKDPDAFVLPDLTTLLHDIDAGAETDARKRLEARRSCRRISRPRRKKSTPSRHCSRRIRFIRWTWNTSFRKTRSSSWTSTQAASCQAAAGATGCTKPSRPRKASRLNARRRRWRPSRSRIISAFITNSRA